MNANKSSGDIERWKDIWSTGQGVGGIDNARSVATLIKLMKAKYNATS